MSDTPLAAPRVGQLAKLLMGRVRERWAHLEAALEAEVAMGGVARLMRRYVPLLLLAGILLGILVAEISNFVRLAVTLALGAAAGYGARAYRSHQRRRRQLRRW